MPLLIKCSSPFVAPRHPHLEGSPTRLLSRVSHACMALSKHVVGVEPPF